MQIEELSVGDWVCTVTEHYPKYLFVSDITKSLVNGTDIQSTTGTYEIKNIYGVPISPSILLGNGFIMTDDCVYYIWDFGSGKVKVNQSDMFEHWYITIYNENDHEILTAVVKYMHDIQHALRTAGMSKFAELIMI